MFPVRACVSEHACVHVCACGCSSAHVTCPQEGDFPFGSLRWDDVSRTPATGHAVPSPGHGERCTGRRERLRGGGGAPARPPESGPRLSRLRCWDPPRGELVRVRLLPGDGALVRRLSWGAPAPRTWLCPASSRGPQVFATQKPAHDRCSHQKMGSLRGTALCTCPLARRADMQRRPRLTLPGEGGQDSGLALAAWPPPWVLRGGD